MGPITLCLIFSVIISIIAQSEASPYHLSGGPLITHINSVQSSWKAGPQTIPIDSVQKKLMDVKFLKPSSFHDKAISLERKFSALDKKEIPEFFDAREKWPECTSIGNIRDQADCGSCWAVSAAETISDRSCIHSNGTINTLISAEDLLSCCDGCGDGCEGGYYTMAWNWWIHQGLVTGGSYESQFGCKPYSISPCGISADGVKWPACSVNGEPTPKCQLKCTSKNGYEKSYKEDKHYGSSAYYTGTSIPDIQSEIMNNGPVQVGFMVYEDFYHYQSGVYIHTAGRQLGGHAVKILGWGVENNVDYWLVANSWNTVWGEKGYFKIRRGTNECGIEEYPVAGLPDVKRRSQ